MSDLVITRSSDHSLAVVDALSDEAIEFVDAYYPPHAEKLSALDSGRIMVALEDVFDFVDAAKQRSLSVESEWSR